MLDSVNPKNINLKRYLGKWNEIASFPAWFQRGCLEVTAEYSKREDNKIGVKNTCKDRRGTKRVAKGTAVPTQKANILQLQFFPLIKADYIIEFLVNAPQGQKYPYVVVGSTGKKYLWILSRTKRVPKEIFDELVSIAEKKGYDVSRLEVRK